MAQNQEHVKTGLFVLLGITLAFVMIVMLADFGAMFESQQRVTVSFNLSDGVKGLKPGSSVALGGEPVGSVAKIEDQKNDQGQVVGKLVHFDLPARYTLYDNARINVQPPLIGTSAVLNIADIGRPVPDQAPPRGEQWTYAEGEVIPGGIAAFSFAVETVRAAGIQDRQRQQIQKIIANVEQITTNLAAEPEKFRAILDNVETISQALADDLPEITAEARTAVADANQIMRDFRRRSDKWFDGLDSIVRTTDQGVASAKSMVDNIRPGVEQSVRSAEAAMADVRRITHTVRTQTLAKIDAALETADQAVSNARETTATLKDLLVTQKPVLQRMLANMRITSDQLKLTAIEVRRAPWRLLYEPTNRELESENLYDAARSFALAAGTLENTAESLRAIVRERDGQVAGDSPDANVQLMLDNLHQSFEQFKQAEQAFWDALKRQRN